jgi:hypothetical protein
VGGTVVARVVDVGAGWLWLAVGRLPGRPASWGQEVRPVANRYHTGRSESDVQIEQMERVESGRRDVANLTG